MFCALQKLMPVGASRHAAIDLFISSIKQGCSRIEHKHVPGALDCRESSARPDARKIRHALSTPAAINNAPSGALRFASPSVRSFLHSRILLIDVPRIAAIALP